MVIVFFCSEALQYSLDELVAKVEENNLHDKGDCIRAVIFEVFSHVKEA